MQYLDIVNKVLQRLREPTVTTVAENDYSALIGEFVNDVKTEVEHAWSWSALRTTLTASTTASLFNYVLVGSGTNSRILDVWNDTSNIEMKYRDSNWMNQQFLVPATVVTDVPVYWNINGVDSNGDMQVDIYPIPDGVYELRFNMVVPQAALSADADVLSVPQDVVIAGAVSRAMDERGVDGGNQAAEMRYRMLLSDRIAIEAGQRPDETLWGSV